MRDRARKAKQINGQNQQNENSTNLLYNNEQQKLYDIFDREIDNEEGSLDIDELKEEEISEKKDNRETEDHIEEPTDEGSRETISHTEQMQTQTEIISRKNIFGSCQSLAYTIISEEEDDKETNESEIRTEEEEREQYKRMVDEFEQRAEDLDKEAKGAGNHLGREVRNMTKPEAERQHRNTVERVLGHDVVEADQFEKNSPEQTSLGSKTNIVESKEAAFSSMNEQVEFEKDKAKMKYSNFGSNNLSIIEHEHEIEEDRANAREIIPLTEKLSAMDIIKSGTDRVPRYYVPEKRYDTQGNERKTNQYESDSDSEAEFASVHESDLESTSSESGDERSDETGFFERRTLESDKYSTFEKDDMDEENESTSDEVKDSNHITSTGTLDLDTTNKIQEKQPGDEENHPETILTNLISSNNPATENSDDIFEEFTQLKVDDTMTQKSSGNKQARPRKLAIKNSLSSVFENDKLETNENVHVQSPVSTEQNRQEVVFRDRGSDINNLMDLMNQSENLLVENQRRGNSFLDMLLGEIKEMEKDPEFQQEMESVHKLIGSDLEKAVEQMNSTVKKATEHGTMNNGTDTGEISEEETSESNSTHVTGYKGTIDSEIGRSLMINEICSIVNNDATKNGTGKNTSATETSHEQMTPILKIVGTSVQGEECLNDESREEDENTYLATIFGGRQGYQTDQLAPRSLLLSETIQRLTESSDSESDSEAPKLCYLSQEKQENVRFRPLIEEITPSHGTYFDGEKPSKSLFDWNASSSSSFESTNQEDLKLINKEENLPRKQVIQLSHDKEDIHSTDDLSNTGYKHENFEIDPAAVLESEVAENTVEIVELGEIADPKEKYMKINQVPHNDGISNETDNCGARCGIPGVSTYKVPLEYNSEFIVKETQKALEIKEKSSFNERVSDEHYIDCVPEFIKPLIQQEEIKQLLVEEQEDGSEVSHEGNAGEGHAHFSINIMTDCVTVHSRQTTGTMKEEKNETHTTNKDEFTPLISAENSKSHLAEIAHPESDEVGQSEVKREKIIGETDAIVRGEANAEDKLSMSSTYCTNSPESKAFKCNEINYETIPQKHEIKCELAREPQTEAFDRTAQSKQNLKSERTSENECFTSNEPQTEDFDDDAQGGQNMVNELSACKEPQTEDYDDNTQSEQNPKFQGSTENEFSACPEPNNDVIAQWPIRKCISDYDLPYNQDHELENGIGAADSGDKMNNRILDTGSSANTQTAAENVKRGLQDGQAGDANKAIWSKENEYFTVERYDPSPSGGLQNAIREVQSEDSGKP